MVQSAAPSLSLLVMPTVTHTVVVVATAGMLLLPLVLLLAAGTMLVKTLLLPLAARQVTSLAAMEALKSRGPTRPPLRLSGEGCQ